MPIPKSKFWCVLGKNGVGPFSPPPPPILENLFEKHNDQIHFDLFKESNIIAHNNNNQGNFNKEINFNTQSLASQIINYKDAYILLEI